MGLAVPGLFATAVLPAYATTADEPGDKSAVRVVEHKPQTLDVSEATLASISATDRDGYSITLPPPPPPVVTRAATPGAAKSGMSVGQALANPPYPNFSLGSVVAVAQQYIGVPYRFGGADPSGFDCSGLVMYVYAQHGISLPHSVRAQASLGTRISREDARPGDIVVLGDLSHNGIWLGNGMILDAPYAGKTVTSRPLWTDNYFIIRVGI